MKALIVGMGKSGLAAAEVLKSLGNEVHVQDSKKAAELTPETAEVLKKLNVVCWLGQEPPQTEQYDLVVPSPGVPPELAFIQNAKAQGAEVAGELELAYRLGRGTYVSITGTNGKTTTTTLIGEIFEKAGRKTYVVGNIGVAVIPVAQKAEADAWLVTETSSFQLETTRDFRPKVSALLNLTPDHMNRHKTMENYGAAKAKIFANQDGTDYFVVNYDDKAAYALAEGCRAKIVPFSRKEALTFGAFVRNGEIVIADEAGQIHEICGTAELKIPGAHNVENVLAAAAVSFFAGIEAAVIGDGCRSFAGVEHRLELCGEVNGVRFINDSKGTNPDSSIKALEAVKGRILLIAGGYDKGSKFEEFIAAFDGKVRYMMLLGVTAPAIRDTAERMGFMDSVMCADMEECVNEAFRRAEPGDTVLLSPACASWDMYTGYEERGRHFKDIVRGLEK